MKIFIDSEFLEDGETIRPISLGLVNEFGKTYYAVFAEAAGYWDDIMASDWLAKNVVPHLPLKDGLLNLDDYHVKPTWYIKEQILEFSGTEPSFWAYYADYDWILFCQIFGRMIDLPDHFPKFCLDLKQYAFELGNPRIPVISGAEHNALEDAKFVKRGYEFLRKLEVEERGFASYEK